MADKVGSLGIRAYARHRAAAKLSGGSDYSVRQAIKAGRLTVRGGSLTRDRKRIRDAAAADVEWAATTKSEMVPLTGPTAPASSAPVASAEPPPTNDLAAARARREAVNADLAEIELGRARGELVLARDVEARFADVFLRCRTKLLGVVVRAREADPTLTETQFKLLDALLREALEDLSGGSLA